MYMPMPMSISMFQVHAACSCPRCMSMSVLHIHGDAACSCRCRMCMSMLNFYYDAAFPCRCFMSMSMPHVYSDATYLVHVRGACPCPAANPCPHNMFMLKLLDAACPCLHAACQCCVHAPRPCCMSVQHAHAACPWRMYMLHVHTVCHAACSWRMPTLHARAACPCCISTVCPYCMSMPQVYAACSCWLFMLTFHAAFPLHVLAA